MPDENIRLVNVASKCEIDLARRELRVLGSPVPIGGRAFEIIEVLARSAGELVTKTELIDRIWPGAIVSENTLHVHAGAIRKALGPGRGLLKTESGRGYRLVGDWIVRRHDAVGPPVGLQRMRVDGESPVTNFPAFVTPLVGRTAAVARLRDLVSAYRVVTLTGPGGIGKTSLALKVARGIVGDFAGGGWLVELASLSDASLVPAATADVLRLQIGPGSVTPEAVARAIGAKKLLLILDNCEHLAGAAATVAETILMLCPHTTIITTSRETLRIQGEHVYRVPPLDVPAPGRDEADHILGHSAVEFFIARTKASNEGFSPYAGELPIIGAICRHLDGIPLAIEFAAAKASTVGVQQVADGLHDRFALLTRGHRTALPRQRTLRGVLDWSYDLLSDSERLLLRHLAIFSGGFTVEAAAGVVGDDFIGLSAVIEDIANLVGKSLVALDRTTPSRWYLLETIRAYALDKLRGDGERDAAARRHATYFREFFSRSMSENYDSVSVDDRAARIREIDNVRAALDWCVSAGGDRAIGVDLAAGSALWMRVDVTTSTLDAPRGSGQSLDLLTKALESAEAVHDLDAQAVALVGIITLYSFCAGHERARAAAERLLLVANRMGDPAVTHQAERLMGTALVMAGKPREALEFLQKVPNVGRSVPDGSRLSGYALAYRGVVRAFLARALWLQGFIDQASQAARTSFDELPVADHPFAVCRGLGGGVCQIMIATGDFAAAEQSIGRLIETATRIHAPFWQTAGRFLAGQSMIGQGEFARGVLTLRDAFDVCRDGGWRMSYPEFKGALATGFVGLGQLDEALTAVNEGLEDVVQFEHGHDMFFAELLRIKGEILLGQQDREAAEASFHGAIENARGQQALLWELRASLGLARLHVEQDRGGEARRLLAQVHDRFTEGFTTPDLRAARALLDELPP